MKQAAGLAVLRPAVRALYKAGLEFPSRHCSSASCCWIRHSTGEGAENLLAFAGHLSESAAWVEGACMISDAAAEQAPSKAGVDRHHFVIAGAVSDAGYRQALEQGNKAFHWRVHALAGPGMRGGPG